MASHSVTHRPPTTWWQAADTDDYRDEIAGQRENLRRFADVPSAAVRGMRVPFLQLGGDAQFSMLAADGGFVFDSSMVARAAPPSWPFTLHRPDLVTSSLCTNGNCPRRAYPTLWELPLNVWYMNAVAEDSAASEEGSDDDRRLPLRTATRPPPPPPQASCQAAMVDGCRPTTKDEALRYLSDNFQRHYRSATRPPFGINMHSAWFAFPGTFDAMSEFVDDVLRNDDVWIVTVHQVLEWMRQPTPVESLNDFSPFHCT